MKTYGLGCVKVQFHIFLSGGSMNDQIHAMADLLPDKIVGTYWIELLWMRCRGQISCQRLKASCLSHSQLLQ
jgi:hypothetical protein